MQSFKCHSQVQPVSEETVVYLVTGGGGSVTTVEGRALTLVKVGDTCLLPVTKPPPLSHQAEGLTVRRQLPQQPLRLPWRLLCVKDQSVGHRLKGLRAIPIVP